MFTPSYFIYLFAALLLADTILSILIVKFVPYTEIDWIAYMQEVGEEAGFLSGDLNYANLRGDTGPLVYPAGFVYIFSILYYLTNRGQDINLAQWLFVGLYLTTTALACWLLRQSKIIPNWAIGLLCLSRRIHSIFMLRCFNDCVATFLLLCAVALFVKDRWSSGCFFFSLAVSVKMNVLLYAPGLLLLLWQRHGFIFSIPLLAICGGLQILLALPFLVTFPKEYVLGAFDFGRVFQYVWTVNFKFLSEEVFVSKHLAKGLLMTQLAVLLAYFSRREALGQKQTSAARISPEETGVWKVFKSSLSSSASRTNLSPDWILSGLFVSNFIGVMFARSLHFQFYVWYFHSLPFLLWLAPLPTYVRLALFVTIEVVWNVFPSTSITSAALWLAHGVLLVSLFCVRYDLIHIYLGEDKKVVREENVNLLPPASS